MPIESTRKDLRRLAALMLIIVVMLAGGLVFAFYRQLVIVRQDCQRVNRQSEKIVQLTDTLSTNARQAARATLSNPLATAEAKDTARANLARIDQSRAVIASALAPDHCP